MAGIKTALSLEEDGANCRFHPMIRLNDAITAFPEISESVAMTLSVNITLNGSGLQ